MSGSAVEPVMHASAGPWRLALCRFWKDRTGRVSLVIVALYGLMLLAVSLGGVGKDWNRQVAHSYAPPSWGAQAGPAVKRAALADAPITVTLGDVDPLAKDEPELARRSAAIAVSTPQLDDARPLGADQWGRDVLLKTLKGTEVSVSVGLAAALAATLIGTVLGAIAGYAGGRVGDALEWFYNVLTSIPYILLILAFAAVMRPGLLNVVLILGLTGWTGIYRLVRAEYMQQREREYVRAAEVMGASHAARMFAHILPNVSHVCLVQLSQHTVSFIKAEVILSFLGFGVPLDQVSWGTMLAEAQTELVMGVWWQLAAATVAMAVLVTAFSLLTDALRDALDPRLS